MHLSIPSCGSTRAEGAYAVVVSLALNGDMKHDHDVGLPGASTVVLKCQRCWSNVVKKWAKDWMGRRALAIDGSADRDAEDIAGMSEMAPLNSDRLDVVERNTVLDTRDCLQTLRAPSVR